MRAKTIVLVCAPLVSLGCGAGELEYTERGDDPAATDGDGSGEDDEDVGGDGIEIAGTWIDSFGITNTITDESWGWQYPGYPDMDFAITQYDNDEGVAIVQNGKQNQMGEHLWGRFEWTFVDDVPYYCQTADGLASEELAADRAPIDHDNVHANCNGYAWFELIPI
jgi:hypothetical protein